MVLVSQISVHYKSLEMNIYTGTVCYLHAETDDIVLKHIFYETRIYTETDKI